MSPQIQNEQTEIPNADQNSLEFANELVAGWAASGDAVRVYEVATRSLNKEESKELQLIREFSDLMEIPVIEVIEELRNFNYEAALAELAGQEFERGM